MKVLNLVTTKGPFFNEQCRVLRKMGVEITTLQVPGRENQGDTRSLTDYVKFYPHVLNHSLDDYDLVHVNYGLTAPLGLTQPRRPVVLSLWGSDLDGRFGSVSRFCARFCDEVIVMSEEMRSSLGQDAHVIPHGIDMKKFEPMGQQVCQDEVGWDPATKHVLFPYDPTRDVKNYPLAEGIVEQVSDFTDQPVELQVVYGIDHTEVPTYMNAADALLLTSHREGFPNSVKEAMACNLPVVSTDVGGLRDRMEPVDNSYVCKTEEALLKRLSEVLSTDQRSNGREYVTDLSVDQMGDDIISVYEQALR